MKHEITDLCKCGKEIWEEDCDECYWKCIREGEKEKIDKDLLKVYPPLSRKTYEPN
jgi:hypothetical protein